MGLLDMLGLGGPEGKVRRLQKKATTKFGPAENRQGAIEELGALKTDAAIDALLTRYTFRVDPGITDDDEKARSAAAARAVRAQVVGDCPGSPALPRRHG
ncbi:MAG: hypothetical protein E6J84_01410 [Deltaproteobacteria bacterium]|nr:MAG: hypothetical protein E6J84_01410 [Deltaproteobacteria bacterium]